ncbi:MAG: HIRAN domain-containing protein [Cellulomonas sp.]|uniref:HIRAN domain-containing protein n=1 Tax=Cellulomonas sp. TaxID=40001 RepID=UPI0019EC54E7|nr:HIRAN domain-containing protein [Cellulomonas sp.]MBF0686393.1 HIRAN domain-containing protein [Cellulomonas sp.]
MATLLRTDQLLVSRQDPTTRRFETVGTLSFDGHLYTFEYAPTATRALPGLPMGRTRESDVLFPIFAERVIDPRRPERPETLKHLGLTREAGPLEVLAVSGGGRTGDTYELTPLPQPGDTSLVFLVHGVRHLTDVERAAIDRLAPGDRLSLRLEADNPVDDRALLVTQDGGRLGYVPGPLLDYVHNIITHDYELVVERVNPAAAGLHMRLLVRLSGRYEI